MTDDDRIQLWLSNLPNHWRSSDDPAVFEQERQDDRLTPPHALKSANMIQTPKRPRIGDYDQAPPRRKRKGSQASSLSSRSLPSSLAVSQQGDMSTAASSPRRQLMGLRLTAGGMDCKQLDTDYPPAVAASLVSDMAAINMGLDLLSEGTKDEILHLVQKHRLEPKLWRNAFTHQDTSKLPGRIPSWTELEEIREQAKECLNSGHEEVSWNMEVHHPLLKSVFQRSDPNQSLDFMSWYVSPRRYQGLITNSLQCNCPTAPQLFAMACKAKAS